METERPAEGCKRCRSFSTNFDKSKYVDTLMSVDMRGQARSPVADLLDPHPEPQPLRRLPASRPRPRLPTRFIGVAAINSTRPFWPEQALLSLGEPAVTGRAGLPPGSACVAVCVVAACLIRQPRSARARLRLITTMNSCARGALSGGGLNDVPVLVVWPDEEPVVAGEVAGERESVPATVRFDPKRDHSRAECSIASRTFPSSAAIVCESCATRQQRFLPPRRRT